MRFLSGLHVSLGEGQKQSWVTITRTGSFTDPRYGRFEITREMLLAMVANFKAGTFGQSIFIDTNHKPQDGAAGEVKELTVEGSRLRALVEWTPLGVEAITKKRMIYLSAEYADNYTDNEEGKQHGPVLLGAALTVRPVIKRLDPVQLSEQEGDGPILLHPELIKSLSQEAEEAMKKHLDALKAALEGMKLPQEAFTTLCDAYTTALGESTDENQAKALAATFEEAGKCNIAALSTLVSRYGYEPSIKEQQLKILSTRYGKRVPLAAQDTPLLVRWFIDTFLLHLRQDLYQGGDSRFVRAMLQASKRIMPKDMAAERLTELRQAEGDLQKRISGFMNAAVSLADPAPAYREIDLLEGKRKRLAQEIAELQQQVQESKSAADLSEADVANALSMLADQVRRVDREKLKDLICRLCERILLDPDTLDCEIHYRIRIDDRISMASPRGFEPLLPP